MFMMDKEINETLPKSIVQNNINATVHGEYVNHESDCYESDANSITGRDNNELVDVLKDLKIVNSKRKLRGLKKFLTNRALIEYAVNRTLKRASKSPEREFYKNPVEKQKIIDRIQYEMETETYHPTPPVERLIKKKGKGDKDRRAHIFCMYDRFVQNLIYVIIEEKFRNKMLPCVYSGVKGRSMFSNNKQYCMANKIHTFCCKHKNGYVLTTDIHHFYESLRSDIVIGVLFKTVTDKYMRVLLYETLMILPTLPIGGTLSQMCAMIVMDECDREIIRRFKPSIYCIFGDNRLAGDDDKKKLIEIKEFQKIYYESRYFLKLKNDYSINSVKNGFWFCKLHYYNGKKIIRAEMRRRAIRGAIRGKKHYAGYKGILLKTDSNNLRYRIEHDLWRLRHKTNKI